MKFKIANVILVNNQLSQRDSSDFILKIIPNKWNKILISFDTNYLIVELR